MRHFFKALLAFLGSFLAVGSPRAELTKEQLTDMMNKQHYVFHVDRPTNPPREIEVIFDLNGFHILDQSKEIVSKSWIDIERVDLKGPLILTHFKSDPDFAVPKAELVYDGAVDYFLVFALKQIVDARVQRSKLQ